MPSAPGIRAGRATGRADRTRYRRILGFALRVLAQVWWFELVLPRIGLGSRAARGRTARLTRLAQRFHALAVELGGLMIKVGQFLSSRLDVLPPEITGELAGLQDEVPAAEFAQIRRLAEAELCVPLDHAYAAFGPAALAAASLGQAHPARLTERDAAECGFERVVVKVQRPGIAAIVDIDLSALHRVAGWLGHLRVVTDRVDPHALVAEFAATSRAEIDYLHEASGAERFGEMFAADARVGVPDVVWERTTRRVLTMSDVTALKLDDVHGLRAHGIDPSEVAAVFAEVMLEQLFGHGYFHADPHPGNVFVTPVPRAEPGEPAWHLTFIDFGMMGEVSDALRNGLRRLLISVAARDGRGLIRAIEEVGILLPTAETSELERAMSRLFERFGGMGVAQLRTVDEREFREFGREFADAVRGLPVQLPESFLLIIRAMSLMSGVCTALDPDFNVWDAVEPYARRLLRDEAGNAVLAAGRSLLSAASIVARLPGRIDALVTRIDDGTVSVATPAVDRRLGRLERLVRRAVGAVVFAGLLVGGILLLPLNAPVGIVLACASAIPLLYTAVGGTGASGGR